MKQQKKKTITLDDLALIMGKGFQEVDKKFVIAIDGYAKKSDTYFQEMLMLAHKVDRMERWILQLAEHAGIQLKA